MKIGSSYYLCRQCFDPFNTFYMKVMFTPLTGEDEAG